MTAEAWEAVRGSVTERFWLAYFQVPMARVLDDAELLRPGAVPEGAEEPQILFRRDAAESFSADMRYGRRPEVELFDRLGIPGPWDGWKLDAWEEKPGPPAPRSAYGGHRRLDRAPPLGRGRAGARLRGPRAGADRSDPGRHRRRRRAPAAPDLRRRASPRPRRGRAGGAGGGLAQGRGWTRPPGEAVVAAAEDGLPRGPYSVTQKTERAPSGDPHDDWHPAPCRWADPSRPGGLPSVKRHGQRVPGTITYEPESGRYDRTRRHRMRDDTAALAQGWRFGG